MNVEGENLAKQYKDKENKYFLVNVISRRAREIVDGERPMVEVTKDDMRPRDIAEEELKEGKLKVFSRTVRHKLVDIVREVSDRS